MRLVIDLQGVQGSSRNRGIGRYSMALATGLVRQRGDNQVVVALNGHFADSVKPLRAKFEELLPAENILVWGVPDPFQPRGPTHADRSGALEAFRESALASADPDFVLVTSMFEGASAVTSIGRLASHFPTAVVLYDLIPLLYRDLYLRQPGQEASYRQKLDHVKKAQLLLAISESSRQEALEHLGFAERNAVNISSAADPHFTPATIDAEKRRKLAERYGLVRPFVMYTGGVDHRKNLRRLIAAYAALPTVQRDEHQLAIVCSMQPKERAEIVEFAARAGLRQDELVLTGFVSEEDLLACYRSCKLFVFPSWHEGFGLPVLEAMKCGRAVIAGNTSSLPEVVGRDDALFDPLDPEAIAAKMNEALANDAFRQELERHGIEQAKKFSWDDTARRAWAALEASHARLTQQRRKAS